MSRARWARLLAPALVAGLAGSAAALPAPASAVPAAVPASFSFSGSGWGHGVGLSQFGAFGMAREGASAKKILTHYFTGTKVGAYRDNQSIAVNLMHRAKSVKLRTEALANGGGAVTVDLGTTELDGTSADTWSFAVSGSHLVVSENGVAKATVGAVVVRWSGTRTPSTTSHDDSLPSVVDVVGGTKSFSTSGHRYRYGSLRIVARASSSGVTRLEVADTMRLGDEYLRGIAEVPSAWPKAVLEAQVIAARSYALVKYGQGFKAGCQCHVDSGRGPYYDQNYVGWVKESAAYGSAWRSAVSATVSSSTTGATVLYKGKPAETFYSSSTGGRTQNVHDVWGSSVPYLKSVDDHWSTEKKYNPTFAAWGPLVRSQAAVAKAFGLPDVRTLDLSSRFVSHALAAATARSSTGATVTISAEAFVTRLSITSTWVHLTPGTAGGGTALRIFPLKPTKKVKKARYFGYEKAHPHLAKSRIEDGAGNAGKKYRASIKLVQGWLRTAGYLHSAPDGGFGPKTNAAVRRFQKAHHVKVTGLVGGGGKNRKGGTWRALQLAAR